MNGGFLFDDDLLLTDNALIRAPDGLFRCWFTIHQPDYVPLASSTFWLEWRLWGMHPGGYHVTNLLLHLVACMLLWMLLRKLAIPGAFLAALLFAIHPVNVESVAWIEQRKNTLSMVFFLLSLLWYLRADESHGSADEDQHKAEARQTGGSAGYGIWYWLSLLAFALAMFSKGSVAILPLELMLIVWWQRNRITSRDLLRLAPFFLISAVLTPIIMWFVLHGTPETVRDISFAERFAGAGNVIWFYLSKAILPFHLIFVYPQWQIDAANVLWWLPWLATLLVTLTLVRQRHNPWARAVLFGWAYYCFALLPVMGFSDAGYMRFSLVADHYQHIALIGVVALAAAGWTIWTRRWQSSVFPFTVATLALITLEILCWQQSRLYADPVTLYQTTLQFTPDSYLVRNNLGVELAKLDRSQEAMDQYQLALQLKPDYALGHYNLGETLLHVGRPEDAIRQYEQALHFDPRLAAAHHNLGNALRKTGHMQEAIEHYQQALELKPTFPEAHFNLGNAFVDTHRLDDAIKQYQEGLRFDSDNAQAHYQMGNALRAAGRSPEAVQHYQEALRLRPDYSEAQINLALLAPGAPPSEKSLQAMERAARAAPNSFEAQYNLAIAQLNVRKPQASIENFQRALTLKPDSTEAHQGLGTALLMLGRPSDAIEHFHQVVRLKPQDAEAHNNLATALANLDRLPEAAEHYQEAVRLRPTYFDAWNNLIQAYEQMHRTDEAIAAARKLLELARLHGQTALADRVQAYLNAHRK